MTKKEKELFDGAIFIESSYEGCKTNIIGTPIAISGMIIDLFDKLTHLKILDKKDIEILLNYIEQGSNENIEGYNELQKKLIKKTLKI